MLTAGVRYLIESDRIEKRCTNQAGFSRQLPASLGNINAIPVTSAHLPWYLFLFRILDTL